MTQEAVRPVRAVMLAKGSSRRLPRKNMQDFLGEPLFVHNVRKLVELGVGPIVDSDDDEILAIAEAAGAVPTRREEALRGPDVPTLPIVRAAFERLTIGPPTCALIVQANSPNIRTETLRHAIDLISRTDIDELMSAAPDRSHNGSVWAVSHDRLVDYGDPYVHRPDVLLVDDSIDIHHETDLDAARAMATATERETYFDCRAPDPSISQAWETT